MPKEHCQKGRADICLAGAMDGVCCPEDSCDIDDEVRGDSWLKEQLSYAKQRAKDIPSWSKLREIDWSKND